MGKLARLIVQPQDVLYDLLGMFQPRVGQYYQADQLYGWSATHTDFPANMLQATGYPVFRKMRFDKIGMRVLGAGAAGARFRIGVYDDKDFYPNKLLVDSGELNAESTGDKIADIDLTLDVGRYWVAYLANDGTIDIPFQDHFLMTRYVGVRSFACRYEISQTYGALPSTFPSGATVHSARVYIIRLRVAEVF